MVVSIWTFIGTVIFNLPQQYDDYYVILLYCDLADCHLDILVTSEISDKSFFYVPEINLGKFCYNPLNPLCVMGT